MDPDATWSMLLNAYRKADWAQVLESSDALQEWPNRGGFPPESLRQMLGIDDVATKAIVLAFCRHACTQAREEGSHAP